MVIVLTVALAVVAAAVASVVVAAVAVAALVVVADSVAATAKVVRPSVPVLRVKVVAHRVRAVARRVKVALLWVIVRHAKVVTVRRVMAQIVDRVHRVRPVTVVLAHQHPRLQLPARRPNPWLKSQPPAAPSAVPSIAGDRKSVV